MDMVHRAMIRNGDGPAMMTMWRINMSRFWRGNHYKYLILGHRLLAGKLCLSIIFISIKAYIFTLSLESYLKYACHYEGKREFMVFSHFFFTVGYVQTGRNVVPSSNYLSKFQVRLVGSHLV